MRAGTRKLSRESVRDWVQRNGVNALPNVGLHRLAGISQFLRARAALQVCNRI